MICLAPSDVLRDVVMVFASLELHLIIRGVATRCRCCNASYRHTLSPPSEMWEQLAGMELASVGCGICRFN